MPTTPSEEEEGSPMLLDAMCTVTVTMHMAYSGIGSTLHIHKKSKNDMFSKNKQINK